MVVQIAADGREMVPGLDAPRLEVPLVADTGMHQHVRRMVRASAEDDFLAGSEPAHAFARLDLDADRASAVEQDPPRVRPGPHLEVRPAHRGPQVTAA